MVSREQKVSQSVQEHVKHELFDVAGYTTDQIEMMDGWDGNDLPTPLEKNIVALGYSFDNGGGPGECGSDLIRRLYTIEYLIFGLNMTWGRNLASVIQQSIEGEHGLIPLLDVGEPGEPQIDVLVLEAVSAERQPTRENPPSWARFVYTVHARIWDEYVSTLVP
jgi:hypothetical protein